MGAGSSKNNKSSKKSAQSKEANDIERKMTVEKIFDKLRKHRKDIKVDPKDNMSEEKFLKYIANGIYKNQNPNNEYFQRQLQHHDSEMSKAMTEKSIKGKLPSNFEWEEVKEIGRGSFGVIMLGIVKKTNKTYAVKKLPAQGNGEALKEAMKEMELLSQLRHKHIVNFKGYQHKEGFLHIFMDYVTGGSIDDQVQKFGNLSEELARSYSKQILKGLAYLHRKKVVHGDLKCANILTTKEGQCKLADFGSAQRILGPQTALDNLIGSIYWMAPEVIKQEGIDFFSDIWSFGALVYEMLVGTPPFYERKGNQFKVMHKIAATNVLPYLDDSISEETRDFVYCCLKRNPKDRWTANQLLHHPFILEKKNDEGSDGDEVVVKIVNTKKEDKEKEKEINKNIEEMIDRILIKRKFHFPNEFLLQDGELYFADDEASPFKKKNSKGVFDIFKKFNSGRHGLVKDGETDYYLDQNGERVYYQKFLKPDFLPKLSDPIDPFELAKKVQSWKKNHSAFDFVSVKLQPTAESKRNTKISQLKSSAELNYEDKEQHQIDYSHLEPYLNENVPNLNHRTKKRVAFQLGEHHESDRKINQDEILEQDMETDIGSALTSCLNSMGNKIIMSKDMLVAKDQNPNENFIKYNNFLYMQESKNQNSQLQPLLRMNLPSVRQTTDYYKFLEKHQINYDL